METAVENQKLWTILSMINWSSEYLSHKGIDSPRLTTELLLSHVLGCERIDLYTHFDKPFTAQEIAQFKLYLKRRLSHEPLQYILGETEFMGLSFAVDNRVLIPRPETEVLVEQVVNVCKDSFLSAIRILDIGTGSGNIAISLAKYIDRSVVDAIDASEDALAVAQLNVQRHHLENRVQLLHGDVLHETDMFNGRQYDVIVSNPPYISEKEFELLQPEIKNFEPAMATTDHGDGLTFFKAIVEKAKTLLRGDGLVFVEMAYNQGGSVPKLFIDAGYQDVTTVTDYGGNERVVKARWK